jgi:sugar O-acyltransferase (sialic acid O-acetyltransferase NeuD family)
MSNKSLILIGGGGHAKVLIDTLQQLGENIIGILDKTKKKGLLIANVEVLGSDEDIENYSPEKIELVNGLGSIKTTNQRRKIFEYFTAKGYHFRSVIHPSAIISTSAKLSQGVQIMAGVVVQTGCEISENCILNTCCVVDHDSQIKAHSHLAPRVTLSGSVSVGIGTHIGTGAVVIQGICIGDHVTVAAGSVVIKNVAENSIVYGIPAKIK